MTDMTWFLLMMPQGMLMLLKKKRDRNIMDIDSHAGPNFSQYIRNMSSRQCRMPGQYHMMPRKLSSDDGRDPQGTILARFNLGAALGQWRPIDSNAFAPNFPLYFIRNYPVVAGRLQNPLVFSGTKGDFRSRGMPGVAILVPAFNIVKEDMGVCPGFNLRPKWA